jgi:hypothetical protein
MLRPVLGCILSCSKLSGAGRIRSLDRLEMWHGQPRGRRRQMSDIAQAGPPTAQGAARSRVRLTDPMSVALLPGTRGSTAACLSGR